MTDIPGPGDRPPLRHDAERNRSRVLAAARKLIAERGLGVGYEEIAREADVGVGTVYRRFPDRDGLHDEVFADRVDAVVEILEEALAVEDPWEGLCQFLRRDFELQTADRGLREFLLGRADSTELRRRSGVRISPLVAELLERARAAGRLRAGVGPGDVAIIITLVGVLMDASVHVEPDLWRRYLAIMLDGIQRGGQRGDLPGAAPERPEVDRILAGWIPPRRGRGQPRDSVPSARIETDPSAGPTP